MAPQSVIKKHRAQYNVFANQDDILQFFIPQFFQIKLKKYKTSENEQSHGSFFLRIGGLGEKNVTKYFFSCPGQLN